MNQSLFVCLRFPDFPARVIAARMSCHAGRGFIVVQQNALSRRSVVCACSPAAAGRGVHAGMSVAEVMKRHRDLAIFPRHREWERCVRDELSCIAEEYTPVYRIDEQGRCLLDLTGTPAQREMPRELIASRLRDEIAYKVGLEDSAIGIGHTRLIAEMMARQARPNMIRVCDAGREHVMLSSLDPRLLPGLSGGCRERIGKYGLLTVGQIQRLGKEALIRRFGTEGEKLYSLINGIDAGSRPKPVPTIHARMVLERDTNDRDLLLRRLRYTADKLCDQLKRSRLRAKKLTVILTYTDRKTVRATVGLPLETDDFPTIAHRAWTTFESLYRRRVALKSIELSIPRPARDSGTQDLFETGWERKQRALGRSIAAVREKLSFDMVLSGSNAG